MNFWLCKVGYYLASCLGLCRCIYALYVLSSTYAALPPRSTQPHLQPRSSRISNRGPSRPLCSASLIPISPAPNLPLHPPSGPKHLNPSSGNKIPRPAKPPHAHLTLTHSFPKKDKKYQTNSTLPIHLPSTPTLRNSTPSPKYPAASQCAIVPPSYGP